MVEVLILLFNLLGWICLMSLCARHNELKSEGRGMPRGASTPDNQFKSSETGSGSGPISATFENQYHFKRPLTRQKKRFGREEHEKKAEERKANDEKTEPKSSKREKKEKKERDAIKGVNKVTKEEIKAANVDGKAGKAKESATKTDHAIEKTQIVDSSLKRSSRSTDINKEGGPVPGETLALLAAAEQMADDKGDYDNFGPPEPKLEK